MNEYLERLVEHVRTYSGCRCVGIRLLDDEGNIPYTHFRSLTKVGRIWRVNRTMNCLSCMVGIALNRDDIYARHSFRWIGDITNPAQVGTGGTDRCMRTD